jgi:hypothetical protein
MGNEREQHLFQLRQAYERRLRILELKEAQQGLDTPAHVISEIQELKDKIIHVDSELNDKGLFLSSNSESAKVSLGIPLDKKFRQVEIVFRGKFDDMSPEIQGAAIRALAAIMNIPDESIRVLSVGGGSIIYRVEVPEDAAHGLHDLFRREDPLIKEIGIIDVRLLPIPRVITTKNSRNETLQADSTPSLSRQKASVYGYSLPYLSA